MAGLLVAIGAMGVVMSMILPVWSQAAKREREAELIFRGEQYMRAIELYQRQYVGAYPPDLETLVDQRFLRRVYEDPMSEDGEFKVIYQSEADDVQADSSGAADAENDEAVRPGGRERSASNPNTFSSRPSGGVVGVVSTSDEASLRSYNGQEKYSEWTFIYATSSTDPAAVAGGGAAGRGAGGRGPGGGARGQGRSGFGTSPDGSFGRSRSGTTR